MAATSAFGQISFDENGNGMGPAGPLPHAVAVDPISGIATLVYTLPFPVTSGDLLLFEQQAATQQSDIVRFEQNQAFFFSDREAGETPDLADVAQLPAAQANAISLTENGPEGNNGVVYTPSTSTPGFPTTGVNVTYNIVSDVVPEPSSIALIVLGAVPMLIARRRLCVR
jgi:hypothetical protein